MDAINLLGLLAGTLTTAAFLPQVIKTWRSRSAGDISLVMFALFSLGVLLWIVYGFTVGAVPVIVANVITLLLSLTILIFKIRYK
ncbi:SemiSWEET transporter [Sulfurivermis fontis]|jgi:MtN3 and saliva related transmembrane protein|uniref:SemiSWEET transporter n=1 Tax=Sulfurivermis fontis TaxID=1972068 RepID=UPI000FD8D081|nr:SemiSWEET transporter [Sulfurivermis fontis]